jgi:hypothetical protein
VEAPSEQSGSVSPVAPAKQSSKGERLGPFHQTRENHSQHGDHARENQRHSESPKRSAPIDRMIVGQGENLHVARWGRWRGHEGETFLHQPIGNEVSTESEFEEFAEAFSLLAGDGDFGGFFVVHFEHEAGFEPGDDFADVMDVDKIRAVGAPEGVGVEGGVKFLEGAVVGGTFEVSGGDGDEAPFDGSEDQVLGVDEEHALLGADQDFAGLVGGLFWRGELGD